MERLMGITIEELLRLPDMRQCRVLGGESGLSRLITNLNVMEVPDVLGWVNAGELLLTTAYAIINDLEAQRSLIPSLAEHGLAGLGIKTKRYMESIPAEMVRQADEYQFPLIELSPDTSHPKLIRAILGEILNKQAVSLNRAVRVHEALIGVTSRGGDLGTIAQTLAGLIQNPVGIWDTAGTRLGFAPGPTDDGVGEALAGQLSAARPWDPQPGSSCVTQEADVDGRSVQQMVVPVVASDKLYGYITAWGLTRPLDTIDTTVLELAVGTVVTQFLTRQMVVGVERRYRNEFLYAWLRGEIRDDEAIVQRGRTLGWDLAHPAVVLVMGVSGADGQPLGSAFQEPVLYWLHSQIAQRQSGAILGEHGSELIAVLSEPAARGSVTALAARLCEHYQARFTHARLRVGVGRPFTAPGGAAQGYSEARKALDLCNALRPDQGVLHYDELGVYKLLYYVDDVAEIERFVAETVGPLLDYDREHNTDLMRTLDAYLETGNLRQTAKGLYTHYNTVLYRMSCIHKILQVDVNAPSQRLNVELAVKLLKLRGELSANRH